MESTGEVSNVEQKNLYNSPLYKKFLSMFDSLPVVSIWLEMSINWRTKSQGPKKKCTDFFRGRIHSCFAGTARNQGTFTSVALWSVQSFMSVTVYHSIQQNGKMILQNLRFLHFHALLWYELEFLIYGISMLTLSPCFWGRTINWRLYWS